jgi:hypothetical protein
MVKYEINDLGKGTIGTSAVEKFYKRKTKIPSPKN